MKDAQSSPVWLNHEKAGIFPIPGSTETKRFSLLPLLKKTRESADFLHSLPCATAGQCQFLKNVKIHFILTAQRQASKSNATKKRKAFFALVRASENLFRLFPFICLKVFARLS